MDNNAAVQDKLSPVTFHVYRKDGSRNPDIKHSFLEKKSLSAYDAMSGYLTLEDKTAWKLVLEQAVSQAFTAFQDVLCLVSFQARIDGNYAIARLYKEDYKSKGRHS